MNTNINALTVDGTNRDDEARTNAALNQLPPTLQLLNRIYVRNVAQRSLLSVTDAVAWLEHDVTVFLRHDKVAVFAIVCGQSVAMADFVTLIDVVFHVNKIGREQSNNGEGPLPNTRTVHAYLTGRLLRIADHGTMPDPARWEPVSYHPLECTSFIRSEDRRQINASEHAELVPGKHKVWCPRLPVSELCANTDGEQPS